MINSLKSNKTSWENELRKLQSSDEYGINFKKLLVAEGSERYYAAKRMLNEKDKLENQTFLLALKEGEKMMLSLECNDKFKAPKMDHIDELPTKEMLLTSAGIKQTMDKLISTAKEVTPKSKIAFINRNQWSKKSMFLESKIRSHLNGSFPNISTFLSFHHKKHKSAKFGIIDSFHLPLIKGETPCVTRLYSRWEYYHNCFVLEEDHCYSSDFENILSNILQNIPHTSNILSHHAPNHNSIPMKGILKAITIDNTLHLRPLCSNKDFHIALNEMVQPSAIFKEAYIQLPDNIKCDHTFKRDSFALYRCSTNIDIKEGIRHSWQSITCNILEQEGARDGLLDCFLCPVMCPQAYTFTPVSVTAVSPVLTSLMTSLTKSLQDITEHGMALSSFTVDIEAAYEQPSHTTGSGTGQSCQKLTKPAMSGLNSPVVMNAAAASTAMPVTTSRSRNGHRGGTSYQAATGTTNPSSTSPPGLSGIRPSPPPPPGSDSLLSSNNYLTSTTTTGKEVFLPEPTFARVLHLCAPPNYIYVDEFQESRRLLVEQAMSNSELIFKVPSVTNNTTGSIDGLDANNNNNSNASTNSYHSSASHTPLLNQTNKFIFDEAQLEANKPAIQTQLSLRSLLSQYSSSTKIRPRLGSGLTTEEEQEDDTLLKSPKYIIRKGTLKKPLLLLLKKDTINHTTDRKTDRKSKISKKEKDWFKKKRKNGNGARGSSMNVLDSIDDASENEGGAHDKDDESFKQESAKLTLDQLFGGNVGDILLGRTRRGSINRQNVILQTQNLLTAETNTTPSNHIEWDPQDDGEGISLFASKTKRQHDMQHDTSHRHHTPQGVSGQGTTEIKLSKSTQMELEAEEVIAKMFTSLPTDELRMELLEFLSCYNQLLEDNENENEEKNYQRRKRLKQRELKPEDNKHHTRAHAANKKPPKIVSAKSNHFIGEEDVEEEEERGEADETADSSSSGDSLDEVDDEAAGGHPGSQSLLMTNGRRKKKDYNSLSSPKKMSAAITPLVYTMIRYRGGVPGEYIPPSSTAFAVQSSLTAPTSSTSESIIFNLWSNSQANRAVSRQKFTNRRHSTSIRKSDRDMINFLMRMNHIHHNTTNKSNATNINTKNKNAGFTGTTSIHPPKDSKIHNKVTANIKYMNHTNKKMHPYPPITTGNIAGRKKSRSTAILRAHSDGDDNSSSVLSLDISLQSSANDNSNSSTFPSATRPANTQSQSQSPKNFDKKKIYSKHSTVGNPITNPTTITTSITVNPPAATTSVGLPVDFLSNRIKRPVASALEPVAPVTPYLDIADTISNEWWSKLNATEDVDDIIAKKITTNQSNNVFYALPRLLLPNLNGVCVKGENKGVVTDSDKASSPRTQSHYHPENHRSGSPVVAAATRTIPPTSRYGSLLDQMHSVDENKSFAAILREVSAQFTKEYGIVLDAVPGYSPSPSEDQRSSTPSTTTSEDSAPRTVASNSPSRSRRSSLVTTMEQQHELLTHQEQQSILNSNTLHGVLHHLKSVEDFDGANTHTGTGREGKRPPAYRLLKFSSVVREEEEEDSGGDDLTANGDIPDGQVGGNSSDTSRPDGEKRTVSPITVMTSNDSNGDQLPNTLPIEGGTSALTTATQGLNSDVHVTFALLPSHDQIEEGSSNNNPTINTSPTSSVKKLSPKKEDSLRMTTSTYHPDVTVNRRGSLGFNTVNITTTAERVEDGRFTFLKLMPELRSGNINLSSSPPRKKSALLSSGLDALSPNHAKPLKPSPRNNRGHSNGSSSKQDNNSSNSSPKSNSNNNTNFSFVPSNLQDSSNTNNPTLGLLKVSGMFSSHPHAQNEPEPPKESKKTSSSHVIGLRSSIRKKSTPVVAPPFP